MGLSSKDLQSLKEQLEKEAGELEAQLGSVSKRPDFGSDTETDFSEEADEAEEVANNLDLSTTIKGRLSDIEVALEKIVRNEYGKCEKCGKDIPMEVLRVDPESKLCKACKAAT